MDLAQHDERELLSGAHRCLSEGSMQYVFSYTLIGASGLTAVSSMLAMLAAAASAASRKNWVQLSLLLATEGIVH